MVVFNYGEWDVICRISPQPICNLFFRQLLVHPDHGVEAAPDPYLGLPTDDPSEKDRILQGLGLGLRSSCSIPRMASAGGQDGSVGNAANIVVCCFSILVVWLLILRSWRRKAAVARIEVTILLVIYGLIKFFEIFDTGSFLEQGGQAIVWLTSIHLTFVVLFFFHLIWFGFLGLQLVEDGSKFSLIPLGACSLFLFIGSIYIFLDTGFGVTHYFSSQPSSHLYSPWTFSMVILWPLIALTIYVFLTSIISIKVLSELKPVIVSIAGLIVLTLAELFRWIITQPICHSSNARVDGSFMASLGELISLIIFVYIWICLTEAEWDDFNDLGYQHYPGGASGMIYDQKFFNQDHHHSTQSHCQSRHSGAVDHESGGGGVDVVGLDQQIGIEEAGGRRRGNVDGDDESRLRIGGHVDDPDYGRDDGYSSHHHQQQQQQPSHPPPSLLSSALESDPHYRGGAPNSVRSQSLLQSNQVFKR